MDTKYILVDLPASLLVAFVHLSALFPEIPQAIIGHDSDDQCRSLLAQPGSAFIFCPSTKISKLPEMGFTPDVAINCGSFQEMSNQAVSQYLNLFSDLGAKSIFSLNYFFSVTGAPEVDPDFPPLCQPMILPNYKIDWCLVNNPLVLIDSDKRNWLEVAMLKLDQQFGQGKIRVVSTYQPIVEALLNRRGLSRSAAPLSMESLVDFALQMFKLREGAHHAVVGDTMVKLESRISCRFENEDNNLRFQELCRQVPDLEFAVSKIQASA